jgi:hypothetical protein
MAQMAKANKLADRILELVLSAEPAAVFEALADAYAFKMSQLECPDCRKQAARVLIEAVPHMLAHANELASEYAAAFGDDAHVDAGHRAHTHLTH